MCTMIKLSGLLFCVMHGLTGMTKKEERYKQLINNGNGSIVEQNVKQEPIKLWSTKNHKFIRNESRECVKAIFVSDNNQIPKKNRILVEELLLEIERAGIRAQSSAKKREFEAFEKDERKKLETILESFVLNKKQKNKHGSDQSK